MTKPATGTAVILAYFGYCALAMGSGAAVFLDTRANPGDPWEPISQVRGVVLTLWFVLFCVHLYGLFAPILLPQGMRHRAYGFFLGSATVGLLTITPLIVLTVRYSSGSVSRDAQFWLAVAGVLALGFVLPLAIAFWWRGQRQVPVA